MSNDTLYQLVVWIEGERDTECYLDDMNTTKLAFASYVPACLMLDKPFTVCVFKVHRNSDNELEIDECIMHAGSE